MPLGIYINTNMIRRLTLHKSHEGLQIQANGFINPQPVNFKWYNGRIRKQRHFQN